MQPSNEMLTELRALAAVHVDDHPLSVVTDPGLLAAATAAYSIGKIDGSVLMARAVLEDLARGE